MVHLLVDLLAILEPLLWWRFGPRHEPPREDLRILGDLAPASGKSERGISK